MYVCWTTWFSETDAHPFSYLVDLEEEWKRFDPDGHYVRRWLPVLSQLPSQYIHRVPAKWSPAECAALPLAGLTAYRAVVTRAKVQRGEIVLVTGIGGGVAQMALQIAHALGAQVFVTSGSDEKLALAQQHGAVRGTNYRSGDWVKSILALTDGVDVVIDGNDA